MESEITYINAFYGKPKTIGFKTIPVKIDKFSSEREANSGRLVTHTYRDITLFSNEYDLHSSLIAKQSAKKRTKSNLEVELTEEGFNALLVLTGANSAEEVKGKEVQAFFEIDSGYTGKHYCFRGFVKNCK